GPHSRSSSFSSFFDATATAEIYPLSLHDALPIFEVIIGVDQLRDDDCRLDAVRSVDPVGRAVERCRVKRCRKVEVWTDAESINLQDDQRAKKQPVVKALLPPAEEESP